ncbi:C40 family peptidase [Streptomyces sp. RKAG337]|uniref:C40 family peptidase n=1 Tax=Streptomyces sp. RKAG337 TaxID=2893404 RepID=UPI00203399C7|nr:C40 family peptidase [Streptomyces sp. RKAG337]MCM2425073.1 NlpC/P60 family protein [Streptomyces sp. RKAG337]
MTPHLPGLLGAAALALALLLAPPPAPAHAVPLTCTDHLAVTESDPDVPGTPGGGGGNESAKITEAARGRAVVAAARSCLGVPYSWGGGTVHGPTLGSCDKVNGYLKGMCQADHTIGFDCSGLTLYAWYQASGGTINLPHRSPKQRDRGRHLKQNELLPGDLLFFAEPKGPIHHVGIYLGGGAMIHAEHTGTLVHTLNDVFHDPKWGPRYVGASRPTAP